MAQCDPIDIPASPIRRLKPELSPKTEEEQGKMKSAIFGMHRVANVFMYLMAMIRPDIAFSVNQVEAYVSAPGNW